ncbi:MAG: hypothetical protein K6F89_07385 [Prevotella sp.]|nr:hypothetical protein [Prevotella sp.]
MIRVRVRHTRVSVSVAIRAAQHTALCVIAGLIARVHGRVCAIASVCAGYYIAKSTKPNSCNISPLVCDSGLNSPLSAILHQNVVVVVNNILVRPSNH